MRHHGDAHERDSGRDELPRRARPAEQLRLPDRDRPRTEPRRAALVMPWEIRPGNLIRVRGVLPNADSLNASTRDGVAVFRIAATEYRQSENAATLELTATPSPSP